MPTKSLAALILLTAACAPATPAPRTIESLEPIPAGEHARTIAAMKPPKRERPVIAVIGQNDGTETTDFIVPYAVLADSGAAEVIAVAPEARAIVMEPALTIRAQLTTAELDARYPEGADYVIVPKIRDAGDPAIVAWIRAQAKSGATIVGICAGTKTLSAAGFFAGRSATSHWYDREDLIQENPTMRWIPNRRYVVDRGVITTTGVSASLPVSLALVEAIAGRERAGELAMRLGVESWDERHDSAAFSLDGRTYRVGLGNKLAFWSHETHAIPVTDGVDDIALAFASDAWSRTRRSKALAVAAKPGVVRTRLGLEVVPDAIAGEREFDSTILLEMTKTASALPEALAGISARYGTGTATFVALQLEYLWAPSR